MPPVLWLGKNVLTAFNQLEIKKRKREEYELRLRLEASVRQPSR